MNYSIKRLHELTGLSIQQLQFHARQGWLPAERIPGVRGFMVKPTDAKKWANERGYNLTPTP